MHVRSVTIITGQIKSGKSTLAKALMYMLGSKAILIDGGRKFGMIFPSTGKPVTTKSLEHDLASCRNMDLIIVDDPQGLPYIEMARRDYADAEQRTITTAIENRGPKNGEATS